MATNYKNILLKDSQGNALLPITLSYYVEYKDGIDVKSYLDTLGSDLAEVNSSIDEINAAIADQGTVQNNIINAVNDILTAYVTKPDHTANIAFDNTYSGLSDELANLQPSSGKTYVDAQTVIQTLDARISYNRDYIDDVETRLATAETTISEHDDDIDTLQSLVGEIFDENGILDLNASAIKYTGTAGAGTDGQTNVQDAIDTIGTQLQTVSADIASVVSQAGVTYVTGYNGILVKGTSETPQQGSVRLDLNVDNDKVIINQSGQVTVDDSKLSIAGSQITGYISSDQIDGGLTADNITISYSYTDANEVVHNDGTKTVQEFYDETQTTLSQIQQETSSEVLDGKYVLSITDDQGANNSYARVYTFQQGNGTAYTINIPKDQFLKTVEYVETAPQGANPDNYPALVFTWNLPNTDANEGEDTSYVPISAFIDAITNDISSDITALQTSVTNINDRLDTIEGSYITGATMNGSAVSVVDNTLILTYNIDYLNGNQTESLSSAFLTSMGITIE